MRAMKRPMPTAAARRRVTGTALVSIFRICPIVRRKKTTETSTMMPRPVCQGTPIPTQIVKAKKALSPIPGASATGKLATSPISRVAKALARTVPRNAPAAGMPAAARITGFTTMM
jgi:hypothetical protein